ncbi:MAG TPA: hypothetical protein VM686_10160, partial [Polyangiaceae bacterium]|nr:hypothetical protein [Polyangiaceae bacterium]
MFAGVALAASVVASPAHAESQLTLQWSAPSDCPVAAEVEEEIRRSLSHLQASGPVRVRGDVEQDEEEYSLRVRVEHEGDVSERVLSVRDCHE